MIFLEMFLKDIYEDFRGATSSEYAILVALIAIVVIGALAVLGALILRLFEFEIPIPG